MWVCFITLLEFHSKHSLDFKMTDAFLSYRTVIKHKFSSTPLYDFEQGMKGGGIISWSSLPKITGLSSNSLNVIKENNLQSIPR